MCACVNDCCYSRAIDRDKHNAVQCVSAIFGRMVCDGVIHIISSNCFFFMSFVHLADQCIGVNFYHQYKLRLEIVHSIRFNDQFTGYFAKQQTCN